MRRSYTDELGHLADTYELLRRAPVQSLREGLAQLGGADAVYVGSGGMLAVAHLAADLHSVALGGLGVATTPVQAVSGPLASENPVVLLSARAKHPDVLATAKAARRHKTRPVFLFTHRDEADLSPDLRKSIDLVATLPSVYPDGFLATNSVVAFATALVHAHGISLPMTLPCLDVEIEKPRFGWDAPRWLIVYGPGARPAAEDLEARFSETGLRDIQVTDVRNFGHGRHVGLDRMSSLTLLIGLAGPGDETMLRRSFGYVPADINRKIISTSLPFPIGALDLMIAGMRLFGMRASDDKYDVARPKVTDWGRRLYHLRWPADNAIRHPMASSGPYGFNAGSPIPRSVALKIRAAGVSMTNEAVVEWYTGALASWLERTGATPLGGVILDYDGTCCTTEGRFEPPVPPVQDAILTLLDAGIILGFASGRGRSLVHGAEGLRGWVPPEYWPHIVVGLYNGALCLRLSEDVPAQTACVGELAAFADVLESYSESLGWKVDRRLHQVTVQTADFAHHPQAGTVALVESMMARRRPNALKLVASAHSVDVVLGATTKRIVLDRVADLLKKMGLGLARLSLETLLSQEATTLKCFLPLPRVCRSIGVLPIQIGVGT